VLGYASWIAWSWRWRQYRLAKCLSTILRRHGVTYQKSWIFITTAVRTFPSTRRSCNLSLPFFFFCFFVFFVFLFAGRRSIHFCSAPCFYRSRLSHYSSFENPNIQKTAITHSAHIKIRRGGADKSLAHPTSRCRRTESIVSLERGVYSCAEFQVFSCYRDWKEAYQATRAISTTWRREPSLSFFFPARQGAEGNTHHSDRNIRGTYTIVYHRHKVGGPV